jgi:hypothetical protein
MGTVFANRGLNIDLMALFKQDLPLLSAKQLLGVVDVACSLNRPFLKRFRDF